MSATGHEQGFEENLAAYALGALQDAEARALERHLQDCQRCQAELGAMRKVVEVLPAAAPTTEPPVELRERVMAAVRADAPEQAVAQDVSEPASPSRRPRPLAGWPGWLRPRAAIASAVVVAALAVVVAVTLGGGGGHTRTYPGIVSARGASASVRVSGVRARLVFARLPTLPARLIYEMWVKRGANPPVPAGALFARTTGTVAVPGGVRGVKAVLVTAEPRPYGSLKPTQKPLIVVSLA